jgi:hypothetical protein
MRNPFKFLDHLPSQCCDSRPHQLCFATSNIESRRWSRTQQRRITTSGYVSSFVSSTDVQSYPSIRLPIRLVNRCVCPLESGNWCAPSGALTASIARSSCSSVNSSSRRSAAAAAAAVGATTQSTSPIFILSFQSLFVASARILQPSVMSLICFPARSRSLEADGRVMQRFLASDSSPSNGRIQIPCGTAVKMLTLRYRCRSLGVVRFGWTVLSRRTRVAIVAAPIRGSDCIVDQLQLWNS